MALLRPILIEVNLFDFLDIREYLWFLVDLLKPCIVQLRHVWWPISLQVHLDVGKARLRPAWGIGDHLDRLFGTKQVTIAYQVIVRRAKVHLIAELFASFALGVSHQ